MSHAGRRTSTVAPLVTSACGVWRRRPPVRQAVPQSVRLGVGTTVVDSAVIILNGFYTKWIMHPLSFCGELLAFFLNQSRRHLGSLESIFWNQSNGTAAAAKRLHVRGTCHLSRLLSFTCHCHQNKRRATHRLTDAKAQGQPLTTVQIRARESLKSTSQRD